MTKIFQRSIFRILVKRSGKINFFILIYFRAIVYIFWGKVFIHSTSPYDAFFLRLKMLMSKQRLVLPCRKNAKWRASLDLQKCFKTCRFPLQVRKLKNFYIFSIEMLFCQPKWTFILKVLLYMFSVKTWIACEIWW